MAIETVVADQWIYTKLAADSTLTNALGNGVNGIWADSVIDPDAAFPLVLFANLSADDLEIYNNERVWTDLVYVVRGVVRAMSYNAASKLIAQRIDTNLHKASGTTTDGKVWGCVRLRPFRLSETLSPGGIQVRHLGGIYRIYAQET